MDAAQEAIATLERDAARNQRYTPEIARAIARAYPKPRSADLPTPGVSIVEALTLGGVPVGSGAVNGATETSHTPSQCSDTEKRRRYNRERQAAFRERQQELLRDRAAMVRATNELKAAAVRSATLPDELKDSLVIADPLYVIMAIARFLDAQKTLPGTLD